MNKGSKIYLKNARMSVKKVFKSKKNLIRYYMYFIPSLILRIPFFIFMPLFVSMDYRVAEMILNDREITFSEIFAPLYDKEKFKTGFRMQLQLFLTWLGGIIVIAAFGFILYFLSHIIFWVIYQMVSQNILYYQGILQVVIMAPAILALVLYLLIFPFYIAPNYYLLTKIDDTDFSGVIKKTYRTLKTQGGKFTMFFNTFAPLFWLLLTLAIFVGLYMVIPPIYSWTYLVELFIFGLIFVRIFPRHAIVTYIANMELFNDLFFKEASTATIRGRQVRIRKGRKEKITNYKDNLVKMFDETVNMSPIEDTIVKEEPIVEDMVEPIVNEENIVEESTEGEN